MTLTAYLSLTFIVYVTLVVSSIHDTTVLGKPKRSPYFLIFIALFAAVWPLTLVIFTIMQLLQIRRWAKQNG